MVKVKTDQTLAQKLRPLLGSDFDVLDDDELEIVVKVIWQSNADWLRRLAAAVPDDPNFRVSV